MAVDGVFEVTQCWCGCDRLEAFSEKYLRCPNCFTLISSPRRPDDFFKVYSDEADFYGKNYWGRHQKELGFSEINQRAREDLPERCLYWLKNILAYKLPPGSSLELGCAHGGLVALMKFLGFEARGLELSSWVVNFAAETFGVSMECGRIEEQNIAPKSLDCLVLMDVLEHFTDPLRTLGVAAAALKDDGIMVIQTPCYKNVQVSYRQFIEQNDLFLQQLKDQEHLYLFTSVGLQLLLKKVGLSYFVEKKALFPYDMFVVAGKSPLLAHDEKAVTDFLEGTPKGRIILALFDLYRKWQASEEDRSQRLDLILKLDKMLAESETDRAARLSQIYKLTARLREVERDRAARLSQINRLTARLMPSERENRARLSLINDLTARLDISERDRGARLEIINQLSAMLGECEQDREARLGVIKELEKRTQSILEENRSKDGDIRNLLTQLKEQDTRLEEQHAVLEKLYRLPKAVQRLLLGI